MAFREGAKTTSFCVSRNATEGVPYNSSSKSNSRISKWRNTQVRNDERMTKHEFRKRSFGFRISFVIGYFVIRHFSHGYFVIRHFSHGYFVIRH